MFLLAAADGRVWSKTARVEALKGCPLQRDRAQLRALCFNLRRVLIFSSTESSLLWLIFPPCKSPTLDTVHPDDVSARAPGGCRQSGGADSSLCAGLLAVIFAYPSKERGLSDSEGPQVQLPHL